LFLLISVHVRTRVHCLILPPVPYIYWSAVCLVYCSFANIGHADTMHSAVSSNWWHNLHLFSLLLLLLLLLLRCYYCNCCIQTPPIDAL
jgi:hypothetical protein